MSKDEARHPMAVVTRRTGLRPDAIRAWERRYRAVEPSRTAANRRLYTENDIERLLLLRSALDAGFQISNVASLPNEEIERLVQGLASIPGKPSQPARAWDRIDHHLRECLERAHALDDEGLERQLEAASVDLSRVELLDSLLVPLMVQVGNAVTEGRSRIANEHLVSTVARAFLDSMRSAFHPAPNAPGIVVTTPVFQHHELAAMIVAATARSEGWRTTYLGANLPAEEIAAAVKKRKARAVALSITWPDDDPDLDQDLLKLGRLIPPGVLIVVGGRGAGGYARILDEIGAQRPKDLQAFRRLLAQTRRSRSIA